MAGPAEAPRTVRPVFVVGGPEDARLLVETLGQGPGVFTRDSAAPDVVDLVPAAHPSAHGWRSGRLTAADASPDVAAAVARLLVVDSRDRDDRRAPEAGHPVVVDGSAMHALRVPFLAAALPEARFVFVHRDAAASLAAALETWRSQRAVAYPDLPAWPGPGWTHALVPEWRELAGLPLEETVARQWRSAVATVVDDLDRLPADRWAVTGYDRLVAEPQREVERLCRFLELPWDRQLPVPLTPRVLGPADPTAPAVIRLLPLVGDVAALAADLLADEEPAAVPAAAPAPGPTAAFGSTYSLDFAELLSGAGVSLLVSTYQSGRLILCRADGTALNTHLRLLPSPMGIAVRPDRIAVGTERRIVTYRNHPNAARNLGDDRYDGCFLPLQVHVTGDIRVHELAYAGDELWAVSTRFSCLVTFDGEHSFVPRWRPPFVSALAADDRCHLNGCAVVGDRIRYATALGVTDTPGGWRDEKGTGGVVLDVPSGDVVLGGLSMPHSPRWHDGRLWVLESGKGTLAVVDPATGAVETVAELPGFTRGLAFVGPYAFVGLSQVRESVFRGLPILDRPDRQCGVWAVDLRTGAVAGHLAFTGAVQEIFDVQVLPLRWPEIGELDGELLGRSFVLPGPSAGTS